MPDQIPDEALEFPCSNCGARLAWSPDADALKCSYCGHAEAVGDSDGTILERPLAEAHSAARGLGIEARVAICGSCGARVAFEAAVTSEHCVYCGSASVLAQEANRNAIRPESLVPLDVSRAAVEESFHDWIKGLWFRPNALKRTARFDAIGVYVPFWTFDCRVHSDWWADAGYYYWETQSYTTVENGRTVHKTRQVRRVRWRPAWGERDDVYDDLLVNASRGIPERLARELGPFDTSALVAYRPEYLAGWRAEEYQLDLEDGWELGHARVEAEQRSRCSGDVPGDTQRNLRVKNRIADVRWKHVLLPVWSVAYDFRGKKYAVLVHGQNGRVVGEAPLSWVKILLAVVFVAAAIGAIVGIVQVSQ